MRRDFFRFVLLVSAAVLLMSESAFSQSRVRQPIPPLFPYQMRALESENAFVVFDFDETVMRVGTPVALFPKGKFRAGMPSFNVTGDEFYAIRDLIGKPGTSLENLEFIPDSRSPIRGSHMFARPGRNGQNHLRDDVVRALGISRSGRIPDVIPAGAKSPFFDLFIKRESNPRTRRGNRILTARGNLPSEMHDALGVVARVREIREQGFIATEASRMKFLGGQGEIDILKAENLLKDYDRAVLEGYELFAFPDDNWSNVEKAVRAFARIERPIPVWIIWTREGAPSELLDLSKLATEFKRGMTVAQLLAQASTAPPPRYERSRAETERVRADVLCRALFVSI